MDQYINNFKTHLCFKYVSTGLCPYHRKCEYIHDIRCTTKCLNIEPKRKIKQYNVYRDESFNWPRTINDKQLGEQYIPFSQNDNNNQAEKSIWNTFLLTMYLINNNMIACDYNNILNVTTNKKRLECFLLLSQGYSLNYY